MSPLVPLERVVVFQPAYLGDVVFAAPLTAAIGRAWPQAEIIFVARPPGDALARFLPSVRSVLTFDKRGADRGAAGLRRVVRQIRALRPDAFVSLHGSPRSLLIARLSGARLRLGPAGLGGSFGFTKRVRWPAAMTFTGRAVAMAEALGLVGDEHLSLVLPEALVRKGAGQLPRPTVAIIPGSVWATKRWPPAHAGSLAKLLAARGFDVIVLGSNAERSLCQEVVDAGGTSCRNLAGTTVEEALGLLAACRAAMGGDSGLTHAARALGIPVATLFGPTSPERHRGGLHDVFLSLGLSCSPCSEHGSKACPLGHHDCLQKLPAALVAERLVPLLAPAQGTG